MRPVNEGHVMESIVVFCDGKQESTWLRGDYDQGFDQDALLCHE